MTENNTANYNKILDDDQVKFVENALEFFDASPDPFHAVRSSIDILKGCGFEEVGPALNGKIVPGGKYYYSKNNSTLVAFAVGGSYKADGNGSSVGGFKVVGAHTDSPNLKIKPYSKRVGSGCIQLGVECYGGGLWHTWFDRDLGVSGRVFVRNNSTGKVEQKLVKIDRGLLRVSNLAIHLSTAEERKAFKVNKEDHLSPILATEVLNSALLKSNNNENKDEEEEKNGWTEHQEPILMQLLSKELNCEIKDIIDFELNLFDIQKANLGGIHSEFIYSARLDNLASCYIALQALTHYCSSPDDLLTKDEDISMIVLYDHEEVGSESATGAASPVMGEAVRSISSALCNKNDTIPQNHQDIYQQSISKSFVLSCDQAHAIHPNYSSKHERNHAPNMNTGMVIKRNCNQRYATNTITGLIVREIARKVQVCPPVHAPTQEFIVRQDCGCGSTIGPMISAATGIRCVDVGCPSLSMHSIRETMGVHDLIHGYDLFKAFYQYFREVDSSIEQ